MKLVAAVLLALSAAPAAPAAERQPYTRNVAIVVYEDAQPLDWTGPFEVYNDAARIGGANGQPAFRVYLVSKTTEPLNAQGIKVVPAYSIENAPRPDIVVIPGGPAARVYDDPAFFAWAKQALEAAEVAQSVCTGAFVLGKAGLLDGLEVTTFWGSIDSLQKAYPKAKVRSGRRFVDNGHVVTTAGISAGIDGSLHVVARLLGRRVADQVAQYMEYRWTPEPYLAKEYAYLNRSTDDRGRLMQTGDMQFEQKSYAAAEAAYRSLVATDPGDRDAWASLGYALRAQDDHLGAARALARAVQGSDADHGGRVHRDAAVEYALAKHADEAVEMLEKAFAAGFTDRAAVDRDPEFASLRLDPRVRRLVSDR